MSTTHQRSHQMHPNATPDRTDDAPSNPGQHFGRRGLLLGGLGLVGAVLAACGDTEAGELGRVGEGPETPTLADAEVNNGVLLRTMAGIETSMATAYRRIVSDGLLDGSSTTFPELGDVTSLVSAFADHHEEAAAVYNELAVAEGAEAWECGNARLDSAVIDVILTRVLDGAPATDAAAAIEPSDDVVRDMVNLVEVMEGLSAASAQALVPQVSIAEIRSAALKIGIRSARQSALLALRLNPVGYVPTSVVEVSDAGGASDGPTATPIPLPVAVPTQFGSLAAITYIGGAGDENGVRLKLNLETPSLNSFAYSFDSCD